MKKRNLRAAALLLAAAMTVGGGSTAFAAEETATGPGLEIEQKEQQNQGAPSGAEEGGQNAGGQGAETPADQGQTGTDGTAPSDTGQETQQQEQASTAPYVSVSYTQGVGTEVTNLSMTLNNYNGIGGVSYRPYVNNGGFIWWNHDGGPSGGTEASTYVEAVEIVLTGDAERDYDIYYCVTSSGQGKMGWAKNGEIAGTSNLGEHLVSIEVMLVPKGQPGPVSVAGRYLNELTNYIRIAPEGSTMTNQDGTPYNGWVSYDHEKFYFKDGKSVSGWQYIDGLKFYFEPSGRLVQDVDSLIGKQSSYVIKVNKALNCSTIYAKDGDNGYIIPVKAMLTSVGDDTPLGTFKTPEKYRWRLMVNDTYTQWATRITQGFLFHSITYAEPDIYKLNTEGYNGLGVSRSLGCVRLTCENAKWVYDNCALGTAVEIYEDSNVASPFDKPDLIPISNSQNWDPTDPSIQR